MSRSWERREHRHEAADYAPTRSWRACTGCRPDVPFTASDAERPGCPAHPGRRASPLEIEAEADAGRALAAAERAADRERATLADLPAVADRKRRLAALPAGADRDAAARAARARGVDRHVEHRTGHRALAVDAAVLVV